MPSNFPASLDNLSNPNGNDQVSVVLHSSQHGNVNDIIEAIEQKLGIGVSAPGATPGVLRRTGSGASGWGQIVDADIDPAAAIAPSKIYSYGLSNPIINGGFEVWQRGTSFPGLINGQYTADRWIYTNISGAVHTALQSTDVPAVAALVPQTNYSLHLDVTTADASIAAGDITCLEQRIEGYNFTPYAQKQFTVGFWAKDTITGIHCLAASNSVADRSCVMEYTVNVADTWEYKTVTFPASPTAGTWDYTNGNGLLLRWSLLAGSNYQTAAGPWQTGQFTGTLSQVNSVSSTANNFKLWGVTMGLGSTVVPYWPRPYQQELALCQRYYEVWGGRNVNEIVAMGVCRTATQADIPLRWAVEKRAAPTVTSSAAADWNVFGIASTSHTYDILTTVSGRLFATVAAGLTAGQATYLIANSSNARIHISAEL